MSYLFTLGHFFPRFFAIEKIKKLKNYLALLLLLFNLLSRALNMIVFSC